MSDWLSVRDAARVAGVHPNTVRNWLRDGRVRSELLKGRHGPTYRILLADVVRQRGEGEPAPAPAPAGTPAGDLRVLVERLAEVEEARVEEVRARAAAEARLAELDDLRRELEDARAEIRSLRAALARALKAGRKGT